MSTFYGIGPQPATRQAVGRFEDEVMIRKDNRYLISTVYLDPAVTAFPAFTLQC
jgi:hypothetical protein